MPPSTRAQARLAGWVRAFLAFAAAGAFPAAAAADTGFITVHGCQFFRDGRPWYAAGANLWYGAYLGHPSNPAGRRRLIHELDALRGLGVNNLRVLGASEASAVPRTLRPSFTLRPGAFDEDLLVGLDFLAQQAGRRGMTLVIFLNNYWDWSGGIPQYLAWGSGRPAAGLGQLPWRQWNQRQSEYYTDRAAQAAALRYADLLLERTNSLTGIKYRDDPTIMAWELANEPRPGEQEPGRPAILPAFLEWVSSVSAHLHARDPHHLVTTGSEGLRGCLESLEAFSQVHAVPTIDYAVIHIWPKNWGWFHPDHFAETIGAAEQQGRAYFLEHLAVARELSKPLVVEEFGLDRDGGPALAFGVICRDRFYGEIFRLVEQSIAEGGPAAGSNFWLWGGKGRPPGPALPAAEDGIGAGDMPQEPPGLNAVFDCDRSTLGVLAAHFSRLAALSAKFRLGKAEK
ncbi:MAG TPA: hypothetical protein VHV47_02850 [Opitutaceae bacterium]|jgi:mannan endo-1,4-beta-mannosidase|nr:hypothetical protein [Opitutaceae bacterium]